MGIHKRTNFATNSQLKLLVTQQDNKLRDDKQILATEKPALFRKLADQEYSGLVYQKLPKLEFILKGERVWLVVANFLVPESFVPASVREGLVTLSLWTSKKANYSLFCQFFSLYELKL